MTWGTGEGTSEIRTDRDGRRKGRTGVGVVTVPLRYRVARCMTDGGGLEVLLPYEHCHGNHGLPRTVRRRCLSDRSLGSGFERTSLGSWLERPRQCRGETRRVAGF